MDDVPYSIKYKKNNFNPILLNRLDSLKIPVAILKNEGLLGKTIHSSKNKSLLENWVKTVFITIGNPTYHPSRCSKVSVDSFMRGVIKILLQSHLFFERSHKLIY